MLAPAVLIRAVLVCVLTLVIGACAGAPRQRPIETSPVNEGAGSLTAARKHLEGRWSLESFEIYPPGKPPVALKGNGTLSYDSFGNLRMDIRVDQSTSDLLRASGIDIRDGLISSDGRAVVDIQNRTLTYVIPDQAPLTKGPLSVSRPRHWQVDGDILTLTTKDDDGKPMSVGRWRKQP